MDKDQGSFSNPQTGLEDPRGKYPKPPFKKQKQPWPGLACKMEPVPDHGEKSYRGSGRLAGRKALAGRSLTRNIGRRRAPPRSR